MPIAYFFDVPVYRCTQEQLESEFQQYKRDFLEYCNVTAESNPYSYDSISAHVETKGLCWIFNEIVGWIRLYSHGTSIKGDFHGLRAKKISKKTRRKEFEYKGKILEMAVFPEEGSTTVLENLLEHIEDLGRRHSFRRFHIDTEGLRLIGGFIDWDRLIRELS